MAEIFIPSSGPQTNVATTIAGLGTATNGASGLIRGATTPYTFMRVVYDSTFGQWVGDPLPIWNGGHYTNSYLAGVTPGAGYIGVGGQTGGSGIVEAGQAMLLYKALTDASLTLQIRVIGGLASDQNDGTLYLAAGYSHFNVGDTAIAAALASQMTSTSGVPGGANVHTLYDTGYQSPTGTAKTFIFLGPMIQKVGGTGAVRSVMAQMFARWIG